MTATPTAAFQAWVKFLAVEGGLSMNPADPGNWTGGRVGVGALKGTKYGIAASSHPDLDIANLTLDQANTLRKTEYWDLIHGDDIHPSAAFVLAEAIYGTGSTSVVFRTMQEALRIAADGYWGPVSRGTLERTCATIEGVEAMLAEFSSQRLWFLMGLSNWPDARGGWTRRLFSGLLVARSLA